MAKTANVPSLDLILLHGGFPCLTQASGARLALAAAICFEERNHVRGVTLKVSGDFDGMFTMGWPTTTPQALREWSDPEEATENGACGVAILLVATLTEYHIVQRSWKSTGFDYRLGLKEDHLFQKAARLEVSGIRKGTSKDVDRRVGQKAEQTRQSDRWGLPAFIVVIEFGARLPPW